MSEAKLTLTMSDEKFIEENYLNMTGEQMARQLGVTKSGYTNSQIVKEYPFATRSIVEKIKNKKSWKHLKW